MSNISYNEGREKFLASVKAGLAEPSVSVHVLPVSNDDVDAALVFAKRVREAGVSCIVDSREGKMKKKLTFASDNSTFFVAIIGSDERANGTITLRDLDEGSQQTILVGEAIAHLIYSCKTTGVIQ